MLLFLNDISGSEILLVLVFILIFFGSKSIPGIARTMGRTMRQIKDASSELQNEIKKSGADMKKDLNLDGLNLDSLIRDTAEDIQRPLDQYATDMENAVKFERPANSHIPVSPPVAEIPMDVEAEKTEIKEELKETSEIPKKTDSPEKDETATFLD